MIKKIVAFILTIIFGIGLGLGLNYGVLNKENKSEYYDAELSVMTFNIRSIQNEPSEEFQWYNRNESLAEQILTCSPDIIGFQEVRYSQRQFLEEKLEGYAFIGRPDLQLELAEINLGGGTYIFYKTQRLELKDSEHYWLSETPNKISLGWDADNMRMAVFGKFFDKLSGKTFVIGNTHLDNVGKLSRENSSKMIFNTLNEYGLPCIFMGDFNVNETDVIYSEFAKRYDDTKYIAQSSTGTLTFHGFGRITSGKAIDFIFVSKNNFKVSKYQVIDKKQNGLFTSDHYPVLVDLITL